MAARVEMLLGDDRPSLTGLTPGVRDALALLGHGGATEDELEAGVLAADGAAGLPVLYFALEAMARSGALSYRVMGEAGVLATAASKTLLKLRTVDPDEALLLSRFALIRRDGAAMTIETPRSAAQVTIADPRVLSLLAMLSTPRRIAESGSVLPCEEVAALCTLLSACGVLAGDGEDHGPLAYWNFHDLLFHARSRYGRHRGGFGGSFPFRGRTEPPPVAKPPMSDDVVMLDKPALHGELTSVVESRRSLRRFGETPISCRELGELLFRAARIREVFDTDTGQQLSRRPYPGAGAVYELEIYATVRECAGLAPGLYHYCPLEHRLERIGDVSSAVVRMATQHPFDAPQVLLTITARLARVFWKYESTGYALILKDVGALMQTLYLVAESMNLAACALGAGDSDAFASASGLDYYEETSVGEFMIGSRGKGAPQ